MKRSLAFGLPKKKSGDEGGADCQVGWENLDIQMGINGVKSDFVGISRVNPMEGIA